MFANIISNIFSVGINIISPLIIIPILTQSMGLDAYGEYVAAIAFSALICVVVDFGFGLYIPKKLSLDNTLKNIKETVSSFLLIKIASLPIIFISVFLVYPDYIFELSIFTFSLSLNFSPILNGLQEYKRLSLYTLISKSFLVIFVVFLDFTSSGIAKAILIQGLSWLVFNALAFQTIQHEYCKGELLKSVSIRSAYRLISDSFEFFIARLFVNIYQHSSTFMVSFILTESLVALYSIVIQLYKVGQAVIGAVSRVLFTEMLRTRNLKHLLTVVNYQLLIWLIGLVIVLIFGDLLLDLVFVFDVTELNELAVICYTSLLFVIVSSSLGYPFLSPIDKDKIAHASIFISALSYYLFFIISCIFSKGNVYALVWCVALSDMVGMVIRLYFFKVYKNKYNC
ncbi:oligosaccharide flippase family protein [Vibrio diabolicus]|uniref:oligosaccharide flippase family protein n=1 Tax=Vibrio diabolicus TaxID=50719 RepID=UPI003751E75B